MKEVYYALPVQEVLRAKNKSVHYFNKSFFTYRGLIQCVCGRLYTPYEQKGAVYYRANCKDGCTNTTPNLTEKEITIAIQYLMDQIYFSDVELAYIESKAKTELAAIAKTRDKKLDDLHLRQRTILADIDYLTQNRITLPRSLLNSKVNERCIRTLRRIFCF